MTSRNDQRREILQQLIHKLESGINIPTKDIRRAVTAEEWAELERKICALPSLKMRGTLPSCLKRYIDCLRRADLLHARAETRGKAANRPLYGLQAFRRSPLSRTAAQEYEYALEILEELLSERPEMQCWLDRPARFDSDGCISPDPAGVPRLITSHSRFARIERSPNKRELNRIALQNSLASLESISVDGSVLTTSRPVS
jgi:hypothetical protein